MIEKGIIKSRTIIVDATHTGSRSNPYSPVELLGLRSKQPRKSLYEVDESIKDKLPSKNTDDELEHELDYTKDLLDVVNSNPSLSEVSYGGEAEYLILFAFQVHGFRWTLNMNPANECSLHSRHPVLLPLT